jgi:stage III sporulation protein SpoIIIAA
MGDDRRRRTTTPKAIIIDEIKQLMSNARTIAERMQLIGTAHGNTWRTLLNPTS